MSGPALGVRGQDKKTAQRARVEDSQDKRFGQIHGLMGAVMFNALNGFLVQEIEAKGVGLRIHLFQEPVAQLDPFFLSDLAFKNGFLDASAVVLAGEGDPAQASSSRLVDGANVVGDDDKHGR